MTTSKKEKREKRKGASVAVRHFFVRDASNFPVACVATDKTDHTIRYALSVCNPLDFDKFEISRMRNIAKGRLVAFINGRYDKKKAAPPQKLPLEEAEEAAAPKRQDFEGHMIGQFTFGEGENVKMALLQTLIEDHEIPKRLRNAASYVKNELTEKHAKRLAEEAAAKAAGEIGGTAPATP